MTHWLAAVWPLVHIAATAAAVAEIGAATRRLRSMLQ